ncbi:MAG: hypothetical protein K2G87_07895 [Oscillospiraceae bacterium]|nr:hypothetical protein [Oscillospiraceae bacterium]
MKIRKIAASAASALIALNFVSIFTYAEERAEYALISAPISEIPDVKSLESMGGGYYLCYDEDGTAFKIVYIGSDEISEWRKTGEFAWKDVECGLDLENYYGCSSKPSEEGNFFGIALKKDGQYYYYYCERSDDHTRITAELFDDAYWADVLPDGYVFAKQGRYCLGKGTELSKIDFGDEVYSEGFSLNSGEYICGVFFCSRWYDPTPHYAALRLADKNGNVTEVYSTPEPSEDNYCSYISRDTMFFCKNTLKNLHWRENYMKDGIETRLHKIYCFQSGELLTFPYNNVLPDGYTALTDIELEDGVFDGRAIMRATTDKGSNNYVLTDTETGEYVSDVYKSLSTRDGEYFLAYDVNGWTLIDRDGNSLCGFDDVTEFYGGLAMACENGEGFLINGNMEKISDTVPAQSAFMGENENIFISSRGGEYYFVTYVKNGADTENPETGNISVLTLVICMAASGFAVIKTGRYQINR